MATLKQITTKAKKLYRKGNAGISWRTAIKRASASLPKKGASAPRKTAKRSKRKSSRRRVGAVPGGARLQMVNGLPFDGTLAAVVNGKAAVNGVSRAKQFIKKVAESKLAQALLNRDKAKGKMKKRKAGKLVTKYRAELKKFS